MMNVILVTGGAGFVGHHVVRALIAEGRTVRVVSRAPQRLRGVVDGVELMRFDLTAGEPFDPVLRDVGTVVHLAAAVPGSAADPAGPDEHVEGTRALVAAARANGIRQFIHVSSAGVYGDGRDAAPHREDDPPAPQSAYERSKLAAERVVVEQGRDGPAWVVLRPTGIHGADRPATVAWYRTVARRRLWLHPPAHVVVHPTYVDDAVQAILRTIDRPDLAGQIFNIGGQRALSYGSLIDVVAAALRVRPIQITVPQWPLRPAAALLGRTLGAGGTVLPPVVNRWSRPLVNRAVDIGKARSMLGFAPVALEEGITEIATELRRRNLL